MELGCVAAIDANGRTIWIADAHRGDGKRFVVCADEKLTAFLELETATRQSRQSKAKVESASEHPGNKPDRQIFRGPTTP
jgi:hypothetical protein